jgi:hypothetical protein
MKPTWRDYLSYYWHRFYRQYTPKGRKEQASIDRAINELFGKENL